MKNNQKHSPVKDFSQTRKNSFWRYSLVFFGVLLMIFVLSATFFGLFFLNSVETSLDLRQQAAVDNNRPEITTSPFDASFFKVDEAGELALQIDSKAQDINEVNWTIQIVASKNLFNLNELKANEATASGLKIANKNIRQDDSCATDHDCYSITLNLELIDDATAFNSHEVAETVAKLSFKPRTEGDFMLSITGDDIYTFTGNFYVSGNGIDFAQCQYNYSAWSECKNFWQTRTYTVTPANCQWHQTETLEELSRQCQVSDGRGGIQANPKYFYLYTFETCFNYPNKGEDLYILWHEEQYPDIAWVDVSNDANFGSYYHKSTKDAYEENDFMIMNAAGFVGATADVEGRALSFQPDKTYYFRLYDDEQERFISSVRYYMGFCSGAQSAYLNCNDRCGEGTDNPERACAEGLSCVEGQCRLTNNPTNEWCLDQPGIGMANRGCDAYCANDGDCAPTLDCYWNHCRLLSNLSDNQCQTASNQQIAGTTSTTGTGSGTQTASSNNAVVDNVGGVFLPSEVYDLTTYACNHGCNTNRDCQADYRCYKGQCRLASNPESMACDANEILIDTSLDRSSSESSGLNLISDEEYAEYWAKQNQQATTPTPTTSVKTGLTGQVAGIFTSLQEKFGGLIADFNWQWLVLAGLLLIVAITLIIIGLSTGKHKIEPKSNNFQVPEKLAAPKLEQATTSKPTVKIPENKPTDL